jgi:hypothetical protein
MTNYDEIHQRYVDYVVNENLLKSFIKNTTFNVIKEIDNPIEYIKKEWIIKDSIGEEWIFRVSDWKDGEDNDGWIQKGNSWIWNMAKSSYDGPFFGYKLSQKANDYINHLQKDIFPDLIKKWQTRNLTKKGKELGDLYNNL